MEWLGINLNHSRPQQWLTQSLLGLSTILLALLAGIVAMLGLWQKSQFLQHHNRTLQTELQQTEQRLHQTTQSIHELKNRQSGEISPVFLQKAEIRQFLQLLTELPINGGLDYAQIEKEKQLSITLAGKLSASDFSRLEQFLKKPQFHYQIAHLQTDAQQKLAFSLTLSFVK